MLTQVWIEDNLRYIPKSLVGVKLDKLQMASSIEH